MPHTSPTTRPQGGHLRDFPPADFLQKLAERMGEATLRKRLRLQIAYSARMFGGGGVEHVHIENIHHIQPVLRVLLRGMGLLERGKRNALDFRVQARTVVFPHLPEGLEGLRILHLSDLHLDGMPDGGVALRRLLAGLAFDLCLVTGDFRYITHSDYRPALRAAAELAPSLECALGVWCVLGNHDFLEMVPGLEANGYRTLLNEHTMATHGGATFCLAGVDDPHFYGAHDFPRALAGRPAGAFTIMLCHSPEPFREAADHRVDFFLAGHTHAGQICLPGGRIVIANADCPRPQLAGPWRVDGMQGFTSPGQGTSGVPVRFHCPPEVTIHTLTRGAS